MCIRDSGSAIRIFCRSVLEAMNQKSVEEIRFYRDDLSTGGESALKTALSARQEGEDGA